MPGKYANTESKDVAGEIIEVIDELKGKKAPGFDGIHPKVLKECKFELAEVLRRICNAIITESEVPEKMKISRVIPIYKKGDPRKLCNYRPISIIPVLAKIFEKLLYKKLLNYFDKYHVLHDNQFGFTKHKSTEIAVMHAINYIQKELDNKNNVIGVFLDLKKAFDVIDHSILLQKLEHYGIRDRMYKLISSYLENRKQYVKIGDFNSDYVINTAGVPQGSVLGPFFFIIYLNDFFYAFNETYIISYADDTSIFFNYRENERNRKIIEIENVMEDISDWFYSSNMYINYEKTKAIMFHNKNKKIEEIEIKINQNIIEYTDNINYLGIIIQKNLYWNLHVDIISKKLARNIGAIYGIREVVTNKILHILYHAFVIPIINYGVTSWGQTTQKNKNRINLLLKRLCRILTTGNSTCNMEEKLFTKVEQLYEFKIGLLMYDRILHNLNTNLITIKKPNHHYNTRNTGNLLPVTARTNLYYNGINSIGPVFWNKLPQEIQGINSRRLFAKRLKQYLLNQ